MVKGNCNPGEGFGGICRRVVAETEQQDEITQGENGMQYLITDRKMTFKRSNSSIRKPE